MRVKINRARIETLFHQALELPAESRERFLELQCGSDTSLHAEVASLLAHYENPESGLDRAIVPPEPSHQTTAWLRAPILDTDELLARRFRIIRRLASGGMGDVYEAEDMALAERVALKTIRPEIASNSRVLARFKKEVQLAKRVSHPNVCRIHDLGIDEKQSGTVLFLTMELLEGETLANYLQQNPLTLTEIRGIASQIAAGLDAAHAVDVIHRDLKSSNVILTQSRAVITDFGIARSAAPDPTSDELTRTGEIVGTPQYMAPEQLLGEPVSHLTDIYAFGVILFEMVTRRLPFTAAAGQSTWSERLRSRPPSPKLYAPGLPVTWERAILRCMDPDPVARFETAGAALSTLETPRAISRTWIPNLSKPQQRRIAGSVAIALLLSGSTWWAASHVRLSSANNSTRVITQSVSASQAANIHYQRGLYFWNLRTQDGFAKAIEEYKAAIHEDGNFAPAHAGLAWVSAMQSGFKAPREAFPEAKKYAQSAIKLNNKLAPAHAALAFVNFYYDWDWKQAEAEFKTAIELDPNYASAHSNYAILLSVRNRFQEALEQARVAEQSDPVSAPVATGLGRVYYWSRRYPEAVQQFQRIFSMHPQFSEAHLSMATALYASHNSDAAVRQISYVLSDSLNSGAIADLAYIYAGIGEKELARSMLLKLENLRTENKRYISPCHLAIVYGALGERDQAFTLLNEGLKERTFEMVYLGINPEYEPLRQDERWRGIVREVGLAQ